MLCFCVVGAVCVVFGSVSEAAAATAKSADVKHGQGIGSPDRGMCC